MEWIAIILLFIFAIAQQFEIHKLKGLIDKNWELSSSLQEGYGSIAPLTYQGDTMPRAEIEIRFNQAQRARLEIRKLIVQKNGLPFMIEPSEEDFDPYNI